MLRGPGVGPAGLRPDRDLDAGGRGDALGVQENFESVENPRRQAPGDGAPSRNAPLPRRARRRMARADLAAGREFALYRPDAASGDMAGRAADGVAGPYRSLLRPGAAAGRTGSH